MKRDDISEGTDYKRKQEWIEAVMADNRLTPATKVYAFGIFQHMYGNKDTSWPGAKALTKATGLNDSQFYLYNRALQKHGYVELTARAGTSNMYRLGEPTSVQGGYPPQERVGVPPQRVGVTSVQGTNTTSNPASKTTRSKTTSQGANAPVETKNEGEGVLNSSLSTEDPAPALPLLGEGDPAPFEVSLPVAGPTFDEEIALVHLRMRQKYGPSYTAWPHASELTGEENRVRARHGLETLAASGW